MDDLRLLRVLREVALRGSFSAAADALAYTQPAVSQQIARLEKQLGVQLVDRRPGGIRLTPAGEALVAHTERILAQLREAEAEIGELVAEARGRVRVCAFATAAGTIVPPAVAAFRRLRPAVAVGLELIDPPESIPALRRGDQDLAVCELGGFSGQLDLDGLTITDLLDDPLYVAVPVDHRFATQRAIPLAELADEEWILVAPRSGCADTNIVIEACRQAGFAPRSAYMSDDYFAILGLVASGMGVALVPGLALVSVRDDVVIRPLRGQAPRRRIAAVTAREPAGATATMIECLRDAAVEHATRSLAAA